MSFWQLLLGITIGLVGIGLLLRYDKRNNPQPQVESDNKTGIWSWIIGIGAILLLLSPHFRKKIKEYIFEVFTEKPEQQEQETKYKVEEEPPEENTFKGTPFEGRDKHGKAFVEESEFKKWFDENPDLRDLNETKIS